MQSGAGPSNASAGLGNERSLRWIDLFGVMPSGIRAFVVILLIAVTLRAFTFGTTGLDWDESLYIVIAQRWLKGDVPYVAVWDQHPMGLPALLAAARFLIGDGLLAARVVALLAVAGTATLVHRILAHDARERLAGGVAAMLYLLYTTRPDGLVANTEIINNFFVTAAAALLIGETLHHAAALRTSRLFIAALLFGIGLQIKYVVLPESVLLCCLVLAWAWRGGVGIARIASLSGILIVGGILPTAVATLYFWQAGALHPYLDANLYANAAYLNMPVSGTTVLARLRSGLVPIASLLPWPFLLAFVTGRSPAHQRMVTLWLAVWLVAGAIDVVLPLKFWKHYFNALVPPLTLTAGLAVASLAQRLAFRPSWLAPAAIGAMALPAIFLILKHAPHSHSVDRPNVPREVAERIRHAGNDGDDIYVFDYDPLVYSYADAVPPTRYVLGIELADFDVSSGVEPATEVSKVLRRNLEWIVVAKPSPYAFSESVRDQLDRVLSDYTLDRQWKEDGYIQPPIDVLLYRHLAPSKLH